MAGPVLGNRRSLVTLVLVFVLGLLLGWWVLGWWLAPVTYKNALPQDLRPDAKNQYLALTADSFSATGDRNVLRQRITDYGWPADQLATDLNLLQSSLASNRGEQQKVQQMAAALGATAAKPAAEAPQGGAQPSAAPGQSSSLLSRLCPGALWLVLILAGVVAVAWLWQRWRQMQGKAGAPAGPSIASQWSGRLRPRPGASDEDAVAAGAGQALNQAGGSVDDSGWYSAGAHQASGHATAAGDWTQESVEASAGGEQYSEPEQLPGQSYAPMSSIYPADEGQGAMAAPASVRSAPQAGFERTTPLGEFTATYHAGEPDYDEAFDVKDANGAVVGQCGLSLMLPVGRGNDQAAALQVWLWEERDQYTQVKVLISEGAYRDTSLRSQLAEEHPALQVRQGVEFDLESYTLRLHGVVDKVSYLDQEPRNQMFEILVTRLQISQRERN